MSKLRTGPIFTQDVLDNLTKALETESETEVDEAVFRQKTHGLQKFLQHGMSRFSVESLKHVLDTLIISNSTVVDSLISIRSLAELRTVVKMTMMRREAGSVKSNDASALMYMENFFFAIFCMSEAKRMFDELFGDLYFSYYNPGYISRQATRISSCKLGHGADGLKRRGVEDYSQFGISTLEQMTGSTEHKLRHTVKDMQDILTRWSNILTDEEPQHSDFEPESEQDILQLRAGASVQPVLRLLPDMFTKFYKSLELAKQWWVLAHEVYPHLPFQRRPSVASSEKDSASSDGTVDKLLEDEGNLTQDERTAHIKKELAETKSAIKDSKEVMNLLQEEMNALEKREEKFEILMETYEKVGREIEISKMEKLKLLGEREKLSVLGESEELEFNEDKLRQQENDLKLLEFQHALLLQDYMIHLEIRPSIIRFQGEITARMNDTQTHLDKQSASLEKLEQELNSVGSNETGSTDDRHVAWEDPDFKTNTESATETTDLPTTEPQSETPEVETAKEASKKHLLLKSTSKRLLAPETSSVEKNEHEDNVSHNDGESKEGPQTGNCAKQSHVARKLSVSHDNNADIVQAGDSTKPSKISDHRKQSISQTGTTVNERTDTHKRIVSNNDNMKHGPTGNHSNLSKKLSPKVGKKDVVTPKELVGINPKTTQSKRGQNAGRGDNTSIISHDQSTASGSSPASENPERIFTKVSKTSKSRDAKSPTKSEASTEVISTSSDGHRDGYRKRSASDPFVMTDNNFSSRAGKRNSLKPGLTRAPKISPISENEAQTKSKNRSPMREDAHTKSGSAPSSKQGTRAPSNKEHTDKSPVHATKNSGPSNKEHTDKSPVHVTKNSGSETTTAVSDTASKPTPATSTRKNSLSDSKPTGPTRKSSVTDNHREDSSKVKKKASVALVQTGASVSKPAVDGNKRIQHQVKHTK